MQRIARVVSLVAVAATLGGSGVVLAQQAAPAAGAMSGPGGGGMGPGMMGGGMGMGRGITDPASYLSALKSNLGITAAQEPAWDEYASTVQGVAMQMQGAHQIMFDAMGTATWQERRDMMDRMFEARQQAFSMVHDAAEKLLPSLSPAQRTRAATCLPGLAAPGRGMMRRMAPPAGGSSS